MKLTVNVLGVDAVFDVSDAREAANLLAEIARQNKEQNGSVAIETHDGDGDADERESVAAEDVSDDEIYKSLLYMSGNPSARLLIELTKNQKGCTDTVLKDKLGLPKIAAVMSHITKCCKKAGIPKEAIYIKRSKRVAKGVVRYHYQITEKAKRVIGGFGDFEKGVAFCDDVDPFDGLF